ncbi:hypothetical protein ACFL47_01985 [Candidatus Latescibacterota bacterium]
MRQDCVDTLYSIAKKVLTGITLQWMNQEEAFLVPPDRWSVQCSINPSDEPIMFIYFGNRRDRRLPGNEHK